MMGSSTQDPPFITSDHGKHGRKKPPAPDMPDLSENPVAVNRKDEHRESMTGRSREEKKHLRKDEHRESMTGRSRDGTFAQKDRKDFFGYKQHSSHGVDLPLVRESVITAASLHDSQVDLSISAILHKS